MSVGQRPNRQQLCETFLKSVFPKVQRNSLCPLSTVGGLSQPVLFPTPLTQGRACHLLSNHKQGPCVPYHPQSPLTETWT